MTFKTLSRVQVWPNEN